MLKPLELTVYPLELTFPAGYKLPRDTRITYRSADRIECAQCRQMVKVQTARKSAPIPMRDTPIYAEMMAERDIQARINQTHARPEVRDALKAGRTRPADKYTLTRKPLLKNGKRS